jgi:hypothetical protein
MNCFQDDPVSARRLGMPLKRIERELERTERGLSFELRTQQIEARSEYDARWRFHLPRGEAAVFRTGPSHRVDPRPTFTEVGKNSITRALAAKDRNVL